MSGKDVTYQSQRGWQVAMASGSGGTQVIVSDRLGSVVKKGTQSYRYYPYGQEIGGATANDTAKYATYTRDAWPGLDYAMNRFYKNEWGRFTSPDQGPPVPTNPQSWNRYSYAWSDPVNLSDPDGLLPAIPVFEGGYGCVSSSFASLGGSVDASSPCPPGMQMQYGSRSSGSTATMDLFNLVEKIEGAGLGYIQGPSGDGFLYFQPSSSFLQLIGVSVPADWPEWWPDILIKVNVWDLRKILSRNPLAIALALEVAALRGGSGSLPPDPDKCPRGKNFYDASQPPHEGWKWNGGGGGVAPGQQGGYWYNSKSPGQTLRSDLDHRYPKGPHCEYTDPFGKEWECDRNGNIFEKGAEWW